MDENQLHLFDCEETAEAFSWTGSKCQETKAGVFVESLAELFLRQGSTEDRYYFQWNKVKIRIRPDLLRCTGRNDLSVTLVL